MAIMECEQKNLFKKTHQEPSVFAHGHWFTLSSIFFEHGNVGLFGSGVPPIRISTSASKLRIGFRISTPSALILTQPGITGFLGINWILSGLNRINGRYLLNSMPLLDK